MSWAEVRCALDAGDPGALTFEMPDVLARVKEHGDLFAPVLTQRQELPGANAQRKLGGAGQSS